MHTRKALLGAAARPAQSAVTLLWLFAVLLFAQLLVASAASAAPGDCDRLGNGTRMGDATVVLAQYVPGGDFTGTDGAKLKALPAFCRVFAIATPRPSSHILIEVWMPDAGKWNGKLLGLGNGGEGGKIDSLALAGGLRRGYATADTDLGSYPAGLPGIGFNFGDGRPEAIRDWAFRATHEMTALAKDVVGRYYGRSAAKAYFVGCSTGGEQGLMEAQRYPDDYDGIIAGAPAQNRTHLHIRFAALRQLGMQPGAAIPPELMKSWTSAIVKACAGRDGGAPGDDYLTNPLQCTLSPRELACKPGETQGACLSKVQVRALERIYDGTRDPRTGDLIYFGDVRGAEAQFAQVYGDTPLAREFDITHWVLPPQRSSASFDFDRDMTALDDKFARDVNAMDPDLSRFAAHGGKLIMFHGWMDGLISPVDSIDYYRRIRAAGRARNAFARLFMVPGMQHCIGGPGATGFGQILDLPAAPDASPANDVLLALDRWSETGAAPDVLLAGPLSLPPALANLLPKGQTATRPICAFPKIAQYDGKGDRRTAASFACVTAPVPKYNRPAPQYLR